MNKYREGKSYGSTYAARYKSTLVIDHPMGELKVAQHVEAPELFVLPGAQRVEARTRREEELQRLCNSRGWALRRVLIA